LTPPRVCNLAWLGTYVVGLWSLHCMSWPAVKSTIITVESVMEPRWVEVVSMTSLSNLDVSVHVGGKKFGFGGTWCMANT